MLRTADSDPCTVEGRGYDVHGQFRCVAVPTQMSEDNMLKGCGAHACGKICGSFVG